MRLLFGRRALREIGEIYDYIFAQDTSIAQRVEDEIFKQCDTIGVFPRSNPPIRTRGVRRCPMVKYRLTIFYRVDDKRDEVTILAVVRGSRVKSIGSIPRG